MTKITIPDAVIITKEEYDQLRTKIVRLVFNNADATPKSSVLNVAEENVSDIMDWYGAYFAGDRYTVTVNGRNIRMDNSGRMIE